MANIQHKHITLGLTKIKKAAIRDRKALELLGDS